MVIASNTTLIETLSQHRLLEGEQIRQLSAVQAGFADAKALAGELIRRKWLTPYQANLLLQGRAGELLLGSYVLLERLGEGGMGQVLKVRNWKLGRIVALKLIRKERLDSEDAIRRFHREIRAAAALSHPNIVMAFDADEVNGTHLLVMEYVEGACDLSRLVKNRGPLPVAQSCEYIRQAALGLQHAFERGMVHRDIKPANLLLTADGKTVKILDMGLARLDSAEGEESSTMTREGAVMGTPDYIAPEQALESHSVDIRADLYSLGCTFYFLLTGRVPFPGGTLIQKINKHQFQEPPAVESLRPNVSPGVARVVRKLMAKKPEDRFQTPAEVVVALATVMSPGGGDDHTVVVERRANAVAETSGDTDAPFASLETEPTGAVNSPHRLAQEAGQGRWLIYLVAGCALFLLGMVALLSLIWKDQGKKRPVTREKQPVVANPRSNPGPAARRTADEKWLKQVAAMPGEKQVEAVTAKLKELNPDFDGKVTPKVEDGVVTEIRVVLDKVTDISPVRVFTALRVLDCSGAEVDDAALASFKSCKDLTHLYLFGNKVGDSALAHFAGCKNLTHLNLSGTQVGDSGLAHLKECKGLTGLQLWNTKVTDSGLAHFKECKNLTQLFLGNTVVGDLGLANFKECKSLTDLGLNDTKVSDKGLAWFAGCKRLMVLNLGSTQVTDSGLAHFAGCTCLLDLGLGNTQVTDKGLAYFKECKGLTGLYLWETQVGDPGLAHFKDCKRLTKLNLSGTKVSDSGLDHIKDCKDLTFLDVRRTKVTAAKIDELKKSLPRCRID